MIQTYCIFSAAGLNFSPKVAEEQLGETFAIKIEKGEIWKKTGKVAGEGYAQFTSRTDLDALLVEVENKIQSLRNLGAEDFGIALEVLHDGQCNFELDQKVIARIANLGLGISISTYLDAGRFKRGDDK